MELEGYAGKVLRVNLSTGAVSYLPTSMYAEKYVGGRGLAARMYWDLVPPEAKAFGPENCLIFVTGPLAGVAGISGSRWQVCSKSADSEHFSWANMGGHWGSQLKFAGYDGLVVEGASEKPVYLVITDDAVEIKDAANLWQRGSVEVREAIKSEYGREYRVVATGPAGDNLVTFASLLADNDASGSGGMAAVMGSKKLKAIAVRGKGKVHIADQETVRDLAKTAKALKDRPPGTKEFVMPEGSSLRMESCFGCVGNCYARLVYVAKDGTRGKTTCQSSWFYRPRAQKFYGTRNEAEFYANRICDSYGINTMAVEPILSWLTRCAQAGVLNDENTGLPLSRMGSIELMEELAKKISYREGFGDILAQGLTKAAEIVGQGTPELVGDLVSKGGHGPGYCPRMYITTGLFYATEPRQPIQELHELSRPVLQWSAWHRGSKFGYVSDDLIRQIAVRFWGSEEAVDFSTYDGKALAAMKIQNRQYSKESLILCDFMWPITHSDVTEDHMGDATIDSKLYAAVTGREMDEEALYKVGERVFNLQRALLVREGHQGRKDDRISEALFTTPIQTNHRQNPEGVMPTKYGESMVRLGQVVEREKFEKMKTEFYELRGWDPETGFQTEAKLRELQLDDVADEMLKRGLAVQNS